MYYQGGYGSPYGGYGAAPQLGALRKQQIDQLLAIYPATNRIQEGIYDLPIQLKATTNIYLRITLTPQFPTTAPRLEVFPKGLSHPLLDPNCLVIDPQLQSWGPHSSLSNIVRSIVDYFLSSPPTSRSSPAPPPRSAAYSGGRVPSPTYIPHAGSPAGGYRGASLPSQQRTPSPCNSGSLGGGPTSSSSNITVPPLDRYSVAELEELARDDARLEKMVNETPEVVAARKKQAELQAKIDQRRSEINAAAEEARAAEAQIAAKQKELDEIKKRNEELEAEKRGIEGKTLPPELAKELAKNAKSADAECDKIVSNFLAGEINAMQFANAYKEMRIVYYTRTKKLDHFRTFNSFKEIMNEERNVDSNNSSSSSNNNNNSDATIRRTAVRVVDYLHKSAEGGGGASARDIAEQNGLYPQKVYDVLAVIGAFPNELTPLAEKRGRVYVTPSRWADGIDSAIVAELQHAKILVEKIKIVLRCTEAGAEEVGRKDMVLKQLEYVKVELPQNYVF